MVLLIYILSKNPSNCTYKKKSNVLGPKLFRGMVGNSNQSKIFGLILLVNWFAFSYFISDSDQCVPRVSPRSKYLTCKVFNVFIALYGVIMQCKVDYIINLNHGLF